MGPDRWSTTRTDAAGGAEREGVERAAGGGSEARAECEGAGSMCSEGEGDKEEREYEEKFRRKKENRGNLDISLFRQYKEVVKVPFQLHQRNRFTRGAGSRSRGRAKRDLNGLPVVST